MSKEQETKMQKYWYYTTIYECVLCGRQTKYRERRYTPKPENWEDRYDYNQEACNDCWYGMKM